MIQFDALQWVIEEVERTEDPKQFSPALIAHRLMMLNLVSVHTTSNTLINVILDLYSSDPARGFLDGLVEEVTRVLAESNGVWTKHAVSRLYRIDSTIRESMRYSAFGIVALPRRVSIASRLSRLIPLSSSKSHLILTAIRSIPPTA